MLTVLFREIFPSKYARSDPEAVWLRLVTAVTASVQPESGRIVYAGPDFPHPIRFRSSKEGPDHIVQNRPGSDLNGWTGFGQTQKSGLEASRCAGIIGAGLWQDATGPPPVSHFQTRLPLSSAAGEWQGHLLSAGCMTAILHHTQSSMQNTLQPLCWLHDRSNTVHSTSISAT